VRAHLRPPPPRRARPRACGILVGVGLFSRKPRTRAEVIADADRARSRGRLEKAAAGYREALGSDPSDPAVHVKLAPVLARLGDEEGGASSFRAAASRYLDAGFTDRAAAVNLAAAGALPLDPGFRLEIARLNLLRGRRADAVGALLDGGRAQLRAKRLDAAASLLRRALELEPWHLEAGLAFAPVLARNGDPAGARRLLDGLDARHPGAARRRVRRVVFRLWPGPRTLWRWVRAQASGAPARPAGSASRKGDSAFGGH
jgi:tetratricopeptide (TPR) repeat protein